jgi:hypothetical protein
MNKMHSILNVFLFLSIISCGNSETADSKTRTDSLDNGTHSSTASGSLAGCYSMISSKDTALLEINLADSTVTGCYITNVLKRTKMRACLMEL